MTKQKRVKIKRINLNDFIFIILKLNILINIIIGELIRILILKSFSFEYFEEIH